MIVSAGPIPTHSMWRKTFREPIRNWARELQNYTGRSRYHRVGNTP